MSDAYLKKLKDPRWQKKRLEVMEKAGFTCKTCQSKDKTLTVHHINYRKGADPWEYHEDELACLCEECHEDIEARIIPLLRMIAVKTHPGIMANIAFALGRAALEIQDEELRDHNWKGFRAIQILSCALKNARKWHLTLSLKKLYLPKDSGSPEILDVIIEDILQ